MPDRTPDEPTVDDVMLRPMTTDDLPFAHALSAELRWPHRPADWAQAFAHAEGIVAERDGEIIATGLRWRWGERHATIGLVIVTPACRGQRIGHRLMSALLDGLDEHTVLLHATAEGRGLYERLGFVRTGELRPDKADTFLDGLNLKHSKDAAASAARIAALVPTAVAPDWEALQGDARYKDAKKLAKSLI